MFQEFLSLVQNGQLTEIERISLQAKSERRVPLPQKLKDGVTGRWLRTAPEFRNGIWTHQAKALEYAAAGQNVVVATGTASGKSLIFQAATFRILESDPAATVLVFYPLKALVADQLESWRTIAGTYGFGKELVARIDGDVDRDEREKIIQSARIVVATPDVIHAWLMSKLAQPSHRSFLSRLRMVVIDEAHVLDSVLGSNFSYLFRRLLSAAKLTQRSAEPHELQVIAASATIANAEGHLKDLTGLDFVSIGEDEDGSPSNDREVLHLASAIGDEARVAEEIQRKLASECERGSFITFVDSRQGVEKLAIKTDLENFVRPYRSGYEADDREEIESALRAGNLRGVISTSALELGINIPHFVIGLNLGVPTSRKSFRQRLGRVGRSQKGCFAIIAEPYAFRRFGTTLKDYYEGSVEPSYLYLENRFIQYAHARCLAEELETLGITGRKVPPGFVNWPAGFKEIFDFAYVGSPTVRPRAFDAIHRIGGDQPHFGYPLRAVAEEAFFVRTGGAAAGPSRAVGNVSLQQAIREAYPGALYLHMAKGWKVQEWRATSFERAIRVSSSQSFGFTRPLIRTFVNIGVEHDSLVDGHFRSATSGFIAECNLQITERVEGFEERGQKRLYKDIRQQNPNMTPKTRDFRTTGVAIQISEAWFPACRSTIAEAIHSLLLREFSISPADVDYAATNISLVKDGQRHSVTDVIVIYDATHGSLRLSEPLYDKLDLLMERLRKAVDMTPKEIDLVPEELVEKLEKWQNSLNSDTVDSFTALVEGSQGTAGWLQVYSPGSVVAKRDVQGILRDIEIVGPEFVTIDGPPRLFYRYRVSGAATALASAESVEAVGDHWSMTFWQPNTNEYKDTTDDLVIPKDRPVSLEDSVSSTEQ